MKKIYFSLKALTFMLVFSSSIVQAQNFSLNTIKNAKPISANGGLMVSSVFSDGLPNVNSPFNFFVNGNLNFNLFNSVNVPLNINYTDRKVNLSQGVSFNQISISPNYKWATAHLGTTSMTFSPYTLNGHQFSGAGLDLNPGLWRLQLMYGRLLKGNVADSLTQESIFKRMGYGYKLEYKPKNSLIGMSMFRAYDVTNSIPEAVRMYDNQVLNPQDNFVVSINAATTLAERVKLSAEYSNSLMTKDKSGYYDVTRSKSLAGIFKKGNATTESTSAFKLQANYNIEETQTMIGLGFEQVDPNYRTLGGYYFVNDIRNYTFNVHQGLLKNAIQIAASLGFQNDNIKDNKATKEERFVANINAQANLKNDLSLNAGFNNFKNFKFVNDIYTQIDRIPGEIIDTLDYSMLSQSYLFNARKGLIKNENHNSSLFLTSSFVDSYNRIDELTNGETHIFNGVLGYSLAFIPSKFNVTLSGSFFRNEFVTSSNLNVVRGIGPSLGLQKKVSELLQMSLNTTYSVVSGAENQNSIWNTQFSSSLKLNTHHRFNLQLGVVDRSENTYLNGNLSYNYSF